MPRPRNSFWTLDAETDPFHTCLDSRCEKCHPEIGGRLPQPFLWGAYNGQRDEYFQFTTIFNLIAWFTVLESMRGSQLFYAHNGGKFDYHFLREFINSDEPILVINGRLSRFSIGEHEFRDSLDIFPNTRLKDFGIKSTIDYTKLESTLRHLYLKEIGAYLKQDCVGLWGIIDRYRNEYGKGLTLAGASMKHWSKMTGRDSPRQSRSQYLQFKPYYNGGRVQCFEFGVKKTDFELIDINSAYPFAMCHAHPLSTRALELIRLPKTDVLIGPCLLSLTCVSHAGALPYRQGDTVFYPEDENTVREYHVTGWEFLAARDFNTLSNVTFSRIYQFGQCINFTDYMQHFFKLREEFKKQGDVAGGMFCKYIVNSLYGKFGANPENYVEYAIATSSSHARWTKKGYLDYKPWDTRTLMVRNPKESELESMKSKWRYYNIATAASITGFVRAYLYRALRSVSGAIYCDTDSIVAKNLGSLPLNNELGSWKHEMSGDTYAIAGKKLYALHKRGRDLTYDPQEEEPDKINWKIASKGANLARLNNAPELIEQIALGKTIRYHPEVPTFSFWRDTPVFVPRNLKVTAKDMSQVPHT